MVKFFESKLIKLTPHFRLSEFLTTSHEQLRLSNSAELTGEYLVNLHRLCMELEIIRANYGYPLTITSGFRGKSLNKHINGAHHSDHLFGSAVDIVAKDMPLLWDTILKLVNEKAIHMRQIINEKGLSWIHLSVNNKRNDYKNNEILYL